MEAVYYSKLHSTRNSSRESSHAIDTEPCPHIVHQLIYLICPSMQAQCSYRLLTTQKKLWELTKALNEAGVQEICEEWLGELSEVLFQQSCNGMDVHVCSH